MEIYDSRLGQDFRFNTPIGTFSSLEHHFYVLDNAGNLPWARGDSLLKECVLKTSKIGFFTIALWAPGAKKLATKIKQEFQVASEFWGSLCGYFDVETDSIQKLFEIRKMFGEGKSGEWGLGGCLEKFSPPTRISFAKNETWGFCHILNQPAKIGCLLYLGEMRQTTFMTKIFDGLDACLAQFPLQSK